MLNRIIGGVLLIVGTSIGAGMLALPIVTAAGGFYHSLLLFLVMWLATVFGAYFILEANLWFAMDSNLISMARTTLGRSGEAVTWLVYLLLLYALIAAYTSGGSDIVRSFFLQVHIKLPEWAAELLFIVILGAVIYPGIRFADWVNRGLMTVKLITYAMLTGLIVSHVHFHLLSGGHWRKLTMAILVVVTSFGYAIIIPSLRTYFKGDVKALRITIFLGSLVALACYLFWDFVVQGTIPAAGANGLVAMATSGHSTSDLTTALGQHSAVHIKHLTHIFTSVCLTTSFVGVSLCLSDFLADGFRLPRVGWGRAVAIIATFLPPFLIVLFYPGIFVTALGYAGIFCVILLMLIPAAMVYSGRYIKKISSGYQVSGGRTLVLIELGFAFLLLLFAIYYILIR